MVALWVDPLSRYCRPVTRDRRHPETVAVHAGRRTDPSTGAVAPPIHPSTTFERADDGSAPYVYARHGAPTRGALEEALAALESGGAAVAFASGTAATAAALRTLRPGDHVVASDDLYHGTRRLLRHRLGPWGLESTFVDTSDPDRIRDAVRPATRLVFCETPSNPLLRITDLAAAASIAHDAGARLVVDNTFVPLLQRPLDLGADLVLYATTKYVNGHGDVVGGAVVARAAEAVEPIREAQVHEGAVPSAFDCWLLLRGIRTLPYRMRAHAANASVVADALSRHPRVTRVRYPGLADHPGHEVAAAQMSAPGGMLSFHVRGGRERALAVARSTELCIRATSLGGPETLIEHRASIEGPDSATPDDLLRLSVGLEHPDDVVADLEAALG